jgi:hypothetical protein
VDLDDAVVSDQRLTVYEDDIIQFWGYCDGGFTYESQAGWTITIPSVSISTELAGSEGFRSGCGRPDLPMLPASATGEFSAWRQGT